VSRLLAMALRGNSPESEVLRSNGCHQLYRIQRIISGRLGRLPYIRIGYCLLVIEDWGFGVIHRHCGLWLLRTRFDAFMSHFGARPTSFKLDCDLLRGA